jgi:hypothetical protein
VTGLTEPAMLERCVPDPLRRQSDVQARDRLQVARVLQTTGICCGKAQTFCQGLDSCFGHVIVTGIEDFDGAESSLAPLPKTCAGPY